MGLGVKLNAIVSIFILFNDKLSIRGAVGHLFLTIKDTCTYKKSSFAYSYTAGVTHAFGDCVLDSRRGKYGERNFPSFGSTRAKKRMFHKIRCEQFTRRRLLASLSSLNMTLSHV